jgi:hypothetical protein
VAKQTGWDGLYWVPLAQERTKRWALQRPMKCVEISFSRRTLPHDLIYIFPAPNLEGTYTYSRPGKYELRFESVQLLHKRYLEGKRSHHAFDCVIQQGPQR